MKEEDEIHTSVSYARGNRLQRLAISNKHAGIVGTPVIKGSEAELIVKAILAMRGTNQKQHKDLHDAGLLTFLPRPMEYKGTAHSWLRNLREIDNHDDWTAETPKPVSGDPSEPYSTQTEELEEIWCPMCESPQHTKQQKLNTKIGFRQLKC